MKHIFYFFIFLLAILFPIETTFAISIPEEKKVAKEFMKMINDKKMILNDPVSTHMVNQVGRHILTFLPTQPFDYSFYVVDDDIFNAFASPGANIFFYRGLITSLDSIDELAGIMAHEIAHASSRHVSESIDRSKYINLGTLAGILAGAIIGSQSDGETGSAVIQGSMAISHTAMLAFTRENETEADEKGIMFLNQSCFSPDGLLSGLMKIRAADFRGVEAIPDYVKTHPGTGNRIAHAETILSGYKPPPDKSRCNIDFQFDMVKYRLLGLYSDIDDTLNLINAQLKEKPTNPAAMHFGLALIYDRKFMYDKALHHIKKALSINIFDPIILYEMGRIYIENREPQRAINVLEGVESDPVMGIMAKYQLGVAYLEMGDLAKAEKLFSLVIKKSPGLFPKAYFHQANILSQQNNTGLSHYYLGVYYSEINTPKTAKIHLRKALEELRTPSERKKVKTLLDKLNKDFPDRSPVQNGHQKNYKSS